jgi:hypothetical protein
MAAHQAVGESDHRVKAAIDGIVDKVGKATADLRTELLREVDKTVDSRLNPVVASVNARMAQAEVRAQENARVEVERLSGSVQALRENKCP